MQTCTLAVDIGASSGRHIVGTVQNGKITLQEVYRFENGVHRENGHLCWDIDTLAKEVVNGLKAAHDAGFAPATIGIDTWAVDFVLLDADNKRIGDAVAYRDERTEGIREALEKEYGLTFADHYARTGIQYQPFNTVYQLMALKKEHPEQLAAAKTFLMVPDYLNYLLCGVPANEYTNASTTALVGADSRDWDDALIEKLGLPRGIFQPIKTAGTVLGHLTPEIQKAVEWLREKGLAKAAKKADRVAAEGVAYAAVVNGIGVVIEVNSETDFAAKTDAFMDLVKNLATVVATENPADVDALKACKYPGSNLTVTEIMQEKVMSIGENMQIRRFARFADNTSVAYVHAGGTHGVLVNLAVEGGIDATEIGKNVAMQIAAMSPKYWDKSQVPQADVDKELAVQVALMDNDPKMASKPAAVKEKIAAGKMAAFYKESCLLQQEFVRSDLYKGDVAGYIADAAKKLGGKVTFVDAVHYIKGEGIEKKADDFAAEVAAQIAGAQK